MISCTDFIPSYSELFKYLEGKGGRQAVLDYWQHLSDTYVKESLGEAAKKGGVRGVYEFFAKNLNEEAADFLSVYDEESDTYFTEMRWCPSKGRLLQSTHMEPYYDYCGHCDALYRGVLESLGLHYELDTTHVDRASCIEKVSRKKA